MKTDTRTPSDILHQGHWDKWEYEQRMVRKDWQRLLMTGGDRIAFNGHVYQLLATHIGAGVYRVFKHEKPETFFHNPTEMR